MIKELIDSEEFISLFKVRGREILRTFITSAEWKKDELEQAVLIIEWKTTSGTMCDSFTFEYDARFGRKPCIYGMRHSLVTDAYGTSIGIPPKVRKAITKYFIAFGFNVSGLLWKR